MESVTHGTVTLHLESSPADTDSSPKATGNSMRLFLSAMDISCYCELKLSFVYSICFAILLLDSVCTRTAKRNTEKCVQSNKNKKEYIDITLCNFSFFRSTVNRKWLNCGMLLLEYCNKWSVRVKPVRRYALTRLNFFLK